MMAAWRSPNIASPKTAQTSSGSPLTVAVSYNLLTESRCVLRLSFSSGTASFMGSQSDPAFFFEFAALQPERAGHLLPPAVGHLIGSALNVSAQLFPRRTETSPEKRNGGFAPSHPT